MNELVFKGTSTHRGHLMPWNIIKRWSFVIVEEQWKSIGERRKRGRVRAEPSDPKRTKGYFRCMVSIDRSTQPPSFISRAGCHTSIGFHGNCELLLHTMRCAPCGVVNEWRSELRNKWNVGYRRDGYVERNHCEAYKVYTVKNKAFNTHTHTHTHMCSNIAIVILLFNPLMLTAAKTGLTILEIFPFQKYYLENIWRRYVNQKSNNNSPSNI